MSYRAQVKGSRVKKTPVLGEGQEERRKHMKRLYFNSVRLDFSSPIAYGVHMIWLQQNSSLLHANQAEHACNSSRFSGQPGLGDATTAAFSHQKYLQGFQLLHNKPSNSWIEVAQINEVRDADVKQTSFDFMLYLTSSEGVSSPITSPTSGGPIWGTVAVVRSKWGCFALPFNSTHFAMKEVRTCHWSEVLHSLAGKVKGRGIWGPIAPCSISVRPSPICAPSPWCLSPHKALVLIQEAKGHPHLMLNVLHSFSPEKSVKIWQICTNFSLTLGCHWYERLGMSLFVASKEIQGRKQQKIIGRWMSLRK